MLFEQSLTRNVLIKMSFRIALVIIATTLISYWHLMSVLESQTKEQLSKYITERGLRESGIFLLAQDNVELMKQQLLQRLQQWGERDPQAEFDRLFVKRQDNFVQNRPETFDGTKQAGVFIDKRITITPEIRRRIITFYELTMAYGVAWYTRFQDTYIIGPENMIAIYWPKVPTWIQNAIQDNLYMPNEEYVFITTQQHNPTRVTAWTGVYYDIAAKSWMLSCVKPVDIGERHIATVGHDIILNELFDRTIEDHLQGTYNFIVRPDGRLIVHPNHIKDILENQGNFNISQINDLKLKRVFELITNQSPTTTVIDNQVDREYLAVTRLQGPNWYFVTVYPKSLLAEKASRTAFFIFSLGILSLFIEVSLLICVLRQQIARPLKKFIAATEKIAAGDFNFHLKPKRQDELGKLANSFNRMTLEINIRETSLIQTKEAVEANNQQLEQEIIQRKRIELELKQAKELADLANQAKSTFLANMSHELRTPLNGILGYTQILNRDKTLTAKQLEGIHIIQRSGNYLLTLINDILDLSRIEMGKVELYPVDFNFNEFIQELVALFQIRAQEKGIAFIYEPFSTLPAGVRADNKRLRQILMNLLGNAIKFTTKGGVTFRVGFYENKIRFQVSDTGIGITPEDLKRLFQPFQQIGDYLSKRAEGTGLGLHITRKLVEMMGGELQVESTLGQGSTFWMDIDLLEVSYVINKEETNQMTITGYLGARRTILVVDDRWENQSVIKSLLTPLGFIILEANNGKEGVSKAQEYCPDLIIMDLVMPIMDGFEAARQIKKINGLERIPIIASSASILDYPGTEGNVCDAFISKPIHADIVLETLKRYLELTWVYDQEVHTAVATTPATERATSSEQPITFPALEQATELFHLSMQGDIAGILKVLNTLEDHQPNLDAFIKKVRELAKNFEEEKICEFIKGYIEPKMP